ncbi:MAG: nucleotidyltransferase domain-containing protein [Bacilli bacterium]|nr:nucleotidyltransferase domain-containing protein [Bacilli bacterium]
MLKKYLQEKKISVYKLSEMSGVPYTTLNELINGKKSIKDCKIKTVESIASSLNLSIERTLSMLNNKQVVLSDSWEKNKEKIFYFPIVENNDNYDCGRIHPLMQKKVNEIYKFVKKEKAVEKVIIFGSAVNIRCNKKSDIDLAVKLKDDCFNLENQNQISEEIQSITDYNADIVWLNKIDPETQLYRNISLKGVVVYE